MPCPPYATITSIHPLQKRHSQSTTMASTSAKNKEKLPAHYEADGKGFMNPWPSFHSHGIEFDRAPATTKLPTQFSRAGSKDSTRWQGLDGLAGTVGRRPLSINLSALHEMAKPVTSLLTPCSTQSSRLDAALDSWSAQRGSLHHPAHWTSYPRINVVVTSHNHYDHLDLTTILRLQKDHKPHFFVSQSNMTWFDSIGFNNRVVECDW